MIIFMVIVIITTTIITINITSPNLPASSTASLLRLAQDWEKLWCSTSPLSKPHHLQFLFGKLKPKLSRSLKKITSLFCLLFEIDQHITVKASKTNTRVYLSAYFEVASIGVYSPKSAIQPAKPKSIKFCLIRSLYLKRRNYWQRNWPHLSRVDHHHYLQPHHHHLHHYLNFMKPTRCERCWCSCSQEAPPSHPPSPPWSGRSLVAAGRRCPYHVLTL